MDSNTVENVDSKVELRKPSNDKANRKYRRRSPVRDSSSSPEGSLQLEDGSSPSRKDMEKVADEKRRKDDDRDLDRDSDRGRSEHGGELFRNSERHSSKSSHSYHRHNDHRKRDKYGDDHDRNYSKSTSHSSRDGRGYYNSEQQRRDHEHRSRDNTRDHDKYYRDKSDGLGHRSRDKDKYSSFERAGSDRRYVNFEESKSGDREKHREDRDGRNGKIDQRRGSGDQRSDRSPAYEESRGQFSDSFHRRESSGHRVKEASWRDTSELDGGKDAKDQESPFKKPKLHSLDGANRSKEAVGNGQHSSSSKQAQETSETVIQDQGYVRDSDIDAAKLAAMKAAELVNKNLIGTGYMSTDQKKKLLWGNKKNAAPEESARRWDTAILGDHERQEKFNKLMGVKGEMKVEHNIGNHDVEKQREQLQLDLEKQYTAGLRRRDGRTVGLGL